ncbi:toxin TcdB middle/N-terminal domain-containing protein [Microbulbifer variabilis]|uniref:toxin TcdB middle/N-terminal domain-containing protein n=1 Tax=Microbulbifer variabilis TaxID=266805 RepID=UPI001CFCFE66|nr:toxin TcdB middle/N-terminal domain-containing protein [Microbulbifer variabilis]
MSAEHLTPTVLSLPRGPGSIEGLGEGFIPQLNSGTGQYQIPLLAPPGRNGLTPNLSLDYNSGSGNGLAGVGVRLSIPYLQRQTSLGLPNYSEWPNGDGIDNNNNGTIDEFDEYDQFIDAQGRELVLTKEGYYRSKIEGGFIRYERLAQGWLLHYPNGVKLYLGTKENSRVLSDNRVFKWYPTKFVDTNGNFIEYHWHKIDKTAQSYLKEITYNHGDAEPTRIQFRYAERPDILTSYRAGYEIKSQYRLASVKMLSKGKPVREYKLEYFPHTESQPLSQLKRITEYGADLTKHRPPLEFSWTRFDPKGVDKHKMPGLSAPIYMENTGFFDLDGDGLMDVIGTGMSNHTYWLNRGANAEGVVEWAPYKKMQGRSNLDLSIPNNLVADFDGDGRTEILTGSASNTHMFGISDSYEWQHKGSLNRAGLPLGANYTRLLDINNDKRTDILSVTKLKSSLQFQVLLNLKQGWSNPISLATHQDLFAVDFANPNSFLADMNGDRLPDIVLASQEGQAIRVVYFPHRGLAGFGERIDFDLIENVPLHEEKIRFTDINGDGRADLVNLNGPRAEFWLNQGLNRSNPTTARFGHQTIITAPEHMGSIDSTRLLDINGNGSQDIIWYQRTSSDKAFSVAELSPHEQPYQLKTIDNGLGKKTTLNYISLQSERLRDKAAGQPWTTKMPIGMQVLKSIEVEDGLSGTVQRSSFSYHNGWYNPVEKSFWGFEGVEAIEHGAGDTPSLHQINEYHLGKTAEALRGQIKDSRREDAQGKLFAQETFTWEAVAIAEPIAAEQRTVTQAQLVSKERVIEERGAGEPVKLLTSYSYDNYGNTTRVEELGRQDGNWNDERITNLRYSAESSQGQDRWILNKPLEKKVTDLNGQLVAKEQWFYDDESFSGTSLGSISKGNLTLHRAWEDASDPSAYIDHKRYRYDRYGNVIAQMDPLWSKQPGHLVESKFDQAYSLFPVEEHIHTGSGVLVAKATYDYGLGAIKTFTDFNGQKTQYQHDTLGRLTAIIKPGDTLSAPTLQYEYQLAQPHGNGLINWVETRQRETQGGGTIDSRHFYDGLGRTLMVRSEGEQPGQVVVSEHNHYGSRGQLNKSYLPYFATGLAYSNQASSAHSRQFRYDALGRIEEVQQPYTAQSGEAVFNRITYQPLMQLLQDEEQTRTAGTHAGAAKRLVFDGLQNAEGQYRLRRVDEIHGATSANGSTWSTHYDYDLNGNFTRLQDAQNNVRTMHYDDLGRMRFLDDPNRGQRWQYFDDAGNLLATRDALGQERHYRYDGANRLFAEYQLSPRGKSPSGANWQPGLQLGSTSPVVSYQYDQRGDESGAFLLGRLAKVTDQAGFEQWNYDARGQVVQRQRKITGPQIDSPLYTSRFAYDSAGRMTQQFYPDNSQVNFEYNARGLLERIPGVVERLDYTANGVLQHRGLANGVETDWGFDERQRLAGLRTQRSGDALTLQEWDYRFDAVSNVLGIDEKRSTNTLSAMAAELGATSKQTASLAKNIAYDYDDVYRLTGVADDNEQVYYNYDKIGNLLQFGRANTRLPDITSADIHITDLRYGGSKDNSNTGASNRVSRGSLPGPQALSWAEGKIEYDENGNRTQAADQTYHWDYHQRLTYAGNKQAADQYGYDFKHQRRFKITERAGGARSVTLYIDGDSEVRDGKLLKYIRIGQNRIARSDQSGKFFSPTEYYLHTHVGSTDLTLDKSGKIVNAFTYKSYGKLENVFGDSTAAPYRYAGKELDKSTGLGYFERRYLQSDFGTFISPDPVLNHPGRFVDPQRWAPYRYARNNPVNYVDPNGETAIKQNDGNGLVANKAELLAIEARYKAMILGAERKGWDVAAGALKNFMSQEKDPFVVSSGWLLQQPSIQEGIEINKQLFYDDVMKKADLLKSGESAWHVDYWDKQVKAELFSEFYYASGTSTLTSYGYFDLEAADDGTVTITGAIRHVWYDRYDWHDGLSVTVPIFGRVGDDSGNKLVESGRAKEFDMHSEWTENVEW